jgi:hypothetical protein
MVSDAHEADRQYMRHKLADVQHHPAFAKHQMLESGSGAIHLRAQAEMLSALRTDTLTDTPPRLSQFRQFAPALSTSARKLNPQARGVSDTWPLPTQAHDCHDTEHPSTVMTLHIP